VIEIPEDEEGGNAAEGGEIEHGRLRIGCELSVRIVLGERLRRHAGQPTSETAT